MKKQLHSIIIVLIVIFSSNILGLVLHAQNKQIIKKKNNTHQAVSDTKDLYPSEVKKTGIDESGKTLKKTVVPKTTNSINAGGYCLTLVTWFEPYYDPEYDETYDRSYGAISVIDAATGTVYGPFFKFDQLFDVVVTPDNSTAIVSCFVESTLYFIDLSNPKNLTLIGSVEINYFAEDLDVTPDGKYLLVTDGGFTPRVTSIDIQTRTIVDEYTMGTYLGLDEYEDELWDIYAYANSIAISADGRTVLAADYFEGQIAVLLLNPATGKLSYVGNVPVHIHPVNVSISPDGKTAIAVGYPREITPADVNDNSLAKTDETEFSSGFPEILNISAPGVVSYVGEVPVEFSPITDEIWISNYGNNTFGQSVVFSPDGKKAYVKSQLDIFALNVVSPGVVTAGNTISVGPLVGGTSGLFGVDVLDIDMNGRCLYFSNHTISDGVEQVGIIDLSTNTLAGDVAPFAGEDKEYIPVGIKFFTTQPIMVKYPNGGEILPVGSAANIRWSANLGAVGSSSIKSSSSPNYVRIEFSTNGGSTWNTIRARYNASSGIYPWTVPNTPSSHCLVRVSKFGNPGINDVSNNKFAIGTNNNEGAVTVWPGDANNDGIVDQNDFNAIKQYENRVGTPRANASLDWFGQEVTPWIPVAATYADCNGDGKINSDDFYVVLNANWGKTHGGLAKASEIVVTDYKLLQNYPNPFNPTTILQFELPEDSRVDLRIYNMLGEEVANLTDNEEFGYGVHQMEWNPSNLSSGVYIYRMNAKSIESGKTFTMIKKMQYLR